MLGIAVMVQATLLLSAKAQVAEVRVEMAEVRADAARAKLEAEQRMSEATKALAAIQEIREKQAREGQVRVCRANQRLIQSAKEQWAMDNRKPGTALPTLADLAGPGSYLPEWPTCASSGTYTINAVDTESACTIHGNLARFP
jgi:hypothetical protein